MGRYYILNGRDAVEEPDILVWMEKIRNENRVIAQKNLAKYL